MDASSQDDTEQPTPADGTGPAVAPRLKELFAKSLDAAMLALLDAARGNDPATATAVQSVLADPARLQAIESSGLLDDTPRPALDDAVRLTVDALGIPHAALKMVTADGGTQASISRPVPDEVTRSKARPLIDSLCLCSVVSGSSLVLDDISDHPLLADFPGAGTGELGTYLGLPFADPEGHVLGTFCAWGPRPHHWSSHEIQLMTDMLIVVCEAVFGR